MILYPNISFNIKHIGSLVPSPSNTPYVVCHSVLTGDRVWSDLLLMLIPTRLMKTSLVLDQIHLQENCCCQSASQFKIFNKRYKKKICSFMSIFFKNGWFLSFCHYLSLTSLHWLPCTERSYYGAPLCHKEAARSKQNTTQ